MFKINVSSEMHALLLTAVALQLYRLAVTVCPDFCLCIQTKAVQ